MNVLLTHRPGGAYGYISDGWLNALRDRGHKVQRWDGTESSWHDFQPHLYLGCSGHKQSIPAKRGACKVAIHVNAYGPVNVDNLNEPQHDIDWVVAQNPEAVFGYGHEDDRIIWSYWTTKHGIQWVPMATAGDRMLYKQTASDGERTHDVVYLGGRWTYKALTIDEYLVPLLQQNQVSFKLYGWGGWQNGICSGTLSDDLVCQFLNTGRIGPCISERHTHNHGIDIPERAFKVALCGAMVIHDPTLSIKRMIPSAIVASSPANFQDQVKYFADPANAAERVAITKQQQLEVLSAHTYHHRISTMLGALGFSAESQHMIGV